MRLFTAIDINDNLRNNITQFQTQLQQYNWDIKWVGKKNIHITLCFIGNVAERDLEKLRSGFAKIAKKVSPFELKVDNLQIIKGRIISLAVGGDVEEFAKLQNVVAGALKESGLKKEVKTYPPHITLGRFRRGKRLSSNVVNLPDFGCSKPIKVNCFSLYSSQLTPKGPMYSIEGTFSLDT